MRVIGLTGGIATGKSQVSRWLREAGAVVVDADALVHAAQRRGRPAWREIWLAFGWPVLLADGNLARRRLGRLVFGDPALRERLNAIMRPGIQRLILQEVERNRQAGVATVVLDVPLLIEGGLYRTVDEVWLVFATPDQQVARVMARDRVPPEAARQRVAAQMPIDAKVGYAHRVLDNTGSLEALRQQVFAAWHDVE
ncbi:MAG: dephospho-CoA kinase [Thermaerobacter sp.]|nr:dephospho-CoA kinase [Thermaerobacter sp.]